MSTAVQSTIGNRKSTISPATLRGLHAEWRKLSPDLTGPEGLTEREFRLYWTNTRLGTKHGRAVNSWNDLSERQAKFVLKEMREATGDGPAYRTRLATAAAALLWGESAETELTARLWQRYQVNAAAELTPAQSHELIEELISRVARREIAMVGDEATPEVLEHKIERVRGRIQGRKAEGQ